MTMAVSKRKATLGDVLFLRGIPFYWLRSLCLVFVWTGLGVGVTCGLLWAAHHHPTLLVVTTLFLIAWGLIYAIITPSEDDD